MPLTIADMVLTEDEYIAYELSSEERHEYINGKLITLPVDSDLENEIAANIAILLRQLLRNKGYRVYMKSVKVKLPDEPQYYYPDVFATKEKTGGANPYIKLKPEVICEVASDTTCKYDLIDKFIVYQKIPSLHYYMLVEPRKVVVQLFYKENANWEAMSFTNKDDVIDLSALQIKFSVKDIYDAE